MAKKRKCGVLLPISSLPSKYGIGCFDKKAYEFVDALKAAGQSYWQILPLGPTSYGDSPYQSFSTFAGNPYFISLEELIKEGVLTKKECDSVDFGDNESSVDYAKLYEGRMILLRKAYERSNIYMDPEFRKFQEEEAWWLKDYALFMAVKKRFGGVQWSEWAEDIRLRWQNALDYYREEMYFEIEFQEYMQFKFRQQWMKLKAYANEKGIQIIGDIPIYVAMDSADTWQTHGSSNSMRKIARHRWPDALRMDFPRLVSSGETRCITGKCIVTPDMNGGSNELPIVSVCMML